MIRRALNAASEWTAPLAWRLFTDALDVVREQGADIARLEASYTHAETHRLELVDLLDDREDELAEAREELAELRAMFPPDDAPVATDGVPGLDGRCAYCMSREDVGGNGFAMTKGRMYDVCEPCCDLHGEWDIVDRIRSREAPAKPASFSPPGPWSQR